MAAPVLSRNAGGVARTEKHKARKRSACVLSVALGVSLSACGGTIAFKDNISISAPAKQTAPEAAKHDLVEVTLDHIVIKDKIHFEIDKAEIRPESFGLLDQVVAVLQENLRVKRVNIIGHTDNDGDDTYNQSLSEKRAAAVRAYLVEHGVEEGRLQSEGRGESDPIVSNDTFKGREENRRVEFLILEQDTTKKVPASEVASLNPERRQ